MPHLDQRADYVIKIEGCVNGNLVDWFGPLHIATAVVDDGRIVTTLSGIVIDQAGLVGLIRHLHSLGIVLLSLKRVASHQ